MDEQNPRGVVMTACPRCIKETGPNGRWRELIYTDGGCSCSVHGAMSLAEVRAAFTALEASSHGQPAPDQSVSGSPSAGKS